MDKELLRDLIARLEKASGPDRELDIAIHNWLFPPDPARAEPMPPDLPEDFGTDIFSLTLHEALNFTASIDAALTLVPEGWVWSVQIDYELPGRAHLHCAMPIRDAAPVTIQADGATPAIALCIAALTGAA